MTTVVDRPVDAIREVWSRFRRDVARWVRPQEIASLDEVDIAVTCKLLYRHRALRAVAWFRLATLAVWFGVPGVPSWIQRRIMRLYGLEVVPRNDIGGGFYVAHPVGCVLVAAAVGENVTVISQATFGTRTDNKWPTLGDNVFVGAGARILGGVSVGDHARVGANAVVLHDVEPHTTVVGVPAHVVERH